MSIIYHYFEFIEPYRAPLPAIVIHAYLAYCFCKIGVNNYSWEWRARGLKLVDVNISIVYC